MKNIADATSLKAKPVTTATVASRERRSSSAPAATAGGKQSVA